MALANHDIEPVCEVCGNLGWWPPEAMIGFCKCEAGKREREKMRRSLPKMDQGLAAVFDLK